MYHPDSCQRSYKPQTKHAERMILPSSSPKHSWTYRWVRGSWETDRRKSRIWSSSFFLSFFFSYKLLTSIAYKLKHLLSYFTHRDDIAFVVVAPFSPFICKLARVADLANCDSAKFDTTPFWATHKVEVQTCAYCASVVHMQTHFYHSLLMMAVFEVLSESLSIRHLVAHNR